jgi:hypothetical protein
VTGLTKSLACRLVEKLGLVLYCRHRVLEAFDSLASHRIAATENVSYVASPSIGLTACLLACITAVADTALFADVGSLCSSLLLRICSVTEAECITVGGCRLSLVLTPCLVVRNLKQPQASQLSDEHPPRSVELGLCLQTDTEVDLSVPGCCREWQRHYCEGLGQYHTYFDCRYSLSCSACCGDCSPGCPCVRNAGSSCFSRCRASSHSLCRRADRAWRKVAASLGAIGYADVHRDYCSREKLLRLAAYSLWLSYALALSVLSFLRSLKA